MTKGRATAPPAHSKGELAAYQALPLSAKITLSLDRIRAFYNHFNGQVYISFSGGKDSTVLLHLVRTFYPEVEAVYIDTGLEFPELKSFVKTFDNVTILRPEKNFREVILEYGYPVVSKEVAQIVEEVKRGLALYGPDWDSARYQKLRGVYKDKDGTLSKFNKGKWRFLLDAPFTISNKCCTIMKKAPAHRYSRETGKYPILGTMAEESMLRSTVWHRFGCNSFTGRNISCKPMSVWTEQDVYEYIKLYDLPICDVYGDIISQDGKWCTTGASRTGCMYCPFGAHLEKAPNRYDRLKERYPKIYEWIMKPVEEGGLGFDEVLSYIKCKH